MEKKQILLLTTIITIISILFVPIDKTDIAFLLGLLALVQGIIYWKIK